jgi:hypothetical protein
MTSAFASVSMAPCGRWLARGCGRIRPTKCRPVSRTWRRQLMVVIVTSVAQIAVPCHPADGPRSLRRPGRLWHFLDVPGYFRWKFFDEIHGRNDSGRVNCPSLLVSAEANDSHHDRQADVPDRRVVAWRLNCVAREQIWSTSDAVHRLISDGLNRARAKANMKAAPAPRAKR